MRSYPSRISVGASTKAENIACKTARRLGALKVSIFPARYRVSTGNTIPRQVFQDCLLDALCVFGNVCTTLLQTVAANGIISYRHGILF